jgi:CHAT domain-containing protein/Tfp pilus assembly protein PilF
VAQSLNNLAELYRTQGRYEEAQPLYQQSLTIRREQLGERHPDVANSLNNLALLYYAQGRYGDAEPLHLQALDIRREQLGERHPDVATSLNNLAGLYYAQGRYGDAEPLFQQVLAIWREQLGERHPRVASSLNNLAELYRAQGRDEEAEPLLQQALTIYREQLGEHHPSVANSLNNLALLYRAQGRDEEAEPLLQQALTIYREQLGERHPLVATNLNNLAFLYRAQGRDEEAEALYQQALAIFREQLGERHPDVATNLNNLAFLYQAQGDWVQAIRTFQEGLEIEEWHLALNLTTLTESQRQDYATTLTGSTNIALSISLQSTEAQALGLTTLLRRKGRLLDAGTDSLQQLRQNLTPADQAVLDEWTTVRQQLAALTFNRPANLSPQQYQAQLAQLEADATALEKTLAQSSAAFQAEAQPVDIATVQAQIPADTVLVEYARYRPVHIRENRYGADRYLVYLLFPNGRIEVVDLGDVADIDAAIQDFSLSLRDITQSPSPSARALSAQIIDPIQPYFTGREHLLISPDSQLNRIPFEALRTAENRYLVQDYQISYLNSGRDLLTFDVTEPSTAPAVIVANPDYEVANASIQIASTRSSQRSAELSQLQFGPLPGTAAEAEAIQQYLPNAEVLTADQATENTLKQTEAPRILHIATHGFFLANVDRPEGNDSRGLVLVAADNAPGSPPQIAVENPLLRSGLALAGFNSRSSGSEDGVLTALEASTLNLFGTQLVVLSACDTGLGDIANGEGVYGLRRAFAIAGAESQLLSLWQVDDFGTQSLMARYYENLTAGMGRSGALRAVQLEMIDSQSRYAHPYYWAAFILAGDWQPLAE